MEKEKKLYKFYTYIGYIATGLMVATLISTALSLSNLAKFNDFFINVSEKEPKLTIRINDREGNSYEIIEETIKKLEEVKEEQNLESIEIELETVYTA